MINYLTNSAVKVDSYILLPQSRDQQIAAQFLTMFIWIKLIENLLSKQTDNKAPATLSKHFTKLKDISVYIDGTGLARLAETFWPSNQWQNAVPLIESMTNRSMGIYGQASKGQLKVEFKSLLDLNKTNQNSLPSITFHRPNSGRFSSDCTV